LSEENERRFWAWIAAESQRRGRDISMDIADYDLRGYWLNGGWKDISGKGHMPDTYKKPNHVTFSDQSKYHGAASPWGVPFRGGRWSQDGSSFTPSETMLRYTHSFDSLQNYMRKMEPGVKLNIDKLR
jgi:hypothetical protein